MRSKIVIIVVALVLGGVAAVLAAGYLRSARTDIAAQNEPVKVLVAQQNLPRGLTAAELIERDLVKSEDVPRQFVAGDAVSSERIIADQVLAAPVSKGEQLTKSRFQYPSQAGLSFSVPEDEVAMTIATDEVKGVAGMLKPGDNVVVYSSFKPQGIETAWTQTTVAKARVLAVGDVVTAEQASAPDDEDGGGLLGGDREQAAQSQSEATYRTVTLALSVRDAGRMAFSDAYGTVHLALLGQNAPAPEKPEEISLNKVDLRKMSSILK